MKKEYLNPDVITKSSSNKYGNEVITYGNVIIIAIKSIQKQTPTVVRREDCWQLNGCKTVRCLSKEEISKVVNKIFHFPLTHHFKR